MRVRNAANEQYSRRRHLTPSPPFGFYHGGAVWEPENSQRSTVIPKPSASVGPGMMRSPLDFGEIGDGARRLADLIEKLESVFAQGLVVDVDRHFVEEGINARTQLCHSAHSGSEIFFRYGAGRISLGGLDHLGERFFLRLPVKLRLRRTGIVAIVLFLFNANDIGRPPIASEQVLAVFAVEELRQRFDPAHNQQQIILTF